MNVRSSLVPSPIACPFTSSIPPSCGDVSSTTLDKPPPDAEMYVWTSDISTFFVSLEADASPIIKESPSANVTDEPDVPASRMLISVAVEVTLVRSVGAMDMFAEPSKDCPAIVLAVASAVAVAAFPLVS